MSPPSQDPELDDLKIRYYSMIVRYQLHNKKWMEVFRAYQAPRRERAALVSRVSVTRLGALP